MRSNQLGRELTSVWFLENDCYNIIAYWLEIKKN